MKKLEEYIALAEKALNEIEYPEVPAGLYEPIKYGMSQGGKRLRPVLLLASYEALGGNPEDVLSQAAAIEMYHNFTLLHDDVMDNADLRRGQPTVCKKWNDNTAILSGDAMLTMASMLLLKNMPAEKVIKLSQTFNKAAIEVFEGQQYDMDFESRNNVTIDEYIHMIRLKTSVLLGCSSKLGAEAADGDSEKCEALYNFAMNLGVAFQLQDDWLDVYGDAKVFGKAIGGDILNNKKTLLLINAMNIAKGADKEELDYLLNSTDVFPAEKIAAVTSIYNRLGIDKICVENIEKYNNIALDYLAKAGLDEDAYNFFVEFDQKIMGRNK